ncbi:anchored repeat ABC transporter, substrate-binding protein [Glycomyces buryatensis]|uniref:Anchored repeat ABC transporter, substrate-binding protein n=1 Tax=Glycomyces buryatensis TaxID=2570927 RepID=A0A4V4HSR7_9ACTN|nr:anchored repeat ABC transporter, substrate-binding protein [Glycomyces buryatensis]THV42776.1 anchored repeat ABC transporter, substrate-binding protein [Glycomyces buryatensis]
MKRTLTAISAAAVVASLALAGCTASAADDGDLNVVVTTEIIADWVANLGGDRVTVTSIVPPGGDPHSYEPSPTDATKVAGSELALTNHLLLEEHALIKLFDSNVPEDVPNLSLAENAEPYGAKLIPLVEDVGLDVIWLGFGVRGETVDRTAEIDIDLVEATGPGDVTMFLTDAFGQPEIYWNTADGLDGDSITLPPNAHTHVNWTFTEPGVYELTTAATLTDDGKTTEAGETTYTFAVGINPRDVDEGATVLDDGHTDLTVDLDTGGFVVRDDERGDLAPEDVVIDVPTRSIEQIPAEEPFAFLGEAGADIYQLPQAVLGKHVHGEIDPHIWQDVANAVASVELISDALSEADPEGRDTYESNRDSYIEALQALDAEVAETIATIPEADRQLVTTHDAFGYLADAYGMQVAGFVVPNPAAEPSAQQVETLTETIADLDVNAVFVEPNLHARAAVLSQVAEDQGVDVCTLHGDALPQESPTYIDMMRQNASELSRCLGGAA